MDSDLRKDIGDETPDLGVKIETLVSIADSLSHAADRLNDGEIGNLSICVRHVYEALGAYQDRDKRDREDQVERLRTAEGTSRALRGRLLAGITQISKEVRADYYHDLHPGIDSRSIRLRDTADALDNLSEIVARAEEVMDSTLPPTTTPSAPCRKPWLAKTSLCP